MPRFDASSHEGLLPFDGSVDDQAERTNPFHRAGAYLLLAAALVVVGFAYDAAGAFACAFAIIAAFRAWQVSSDRRGIRVLREVIRKYEQACDASSQSAQVP